MQTIGLVGGMSWESSAVYYRDLNLGVQERLGGLSSPRLVLSTVDFAELTDLEEAERWDQIGELLADAGRGVERAGADFLLLCTTTFHKVADQVEAAVDIPLLHLADVVAEACLAQGATTVGFIGTTVAMADAFFTDRLGRHGVDGARARRASTTTGSTPPSTTSSCTARSSTPPAAAWSRSSRSSGTPAPRAILLGCTELELLVHQADVELPVFPCTTLHVNAALDRALA